MTLTLRGWQKLTVLLLLLWPVAFLRAENPNDLPIPTTYVNDFAHVLSPAGAQRIEDLSLAVQNQAKANLFVVTIKTLDNGQSVEEFTDQLEEHWKAGQKNVDRSAIFLLVVNPHKLRIETGYGLEGILNDAKVGAILDKVRPLAAAGDYDNALLAADQGLADVIGKDAGVTITPVVHQYHRAPAPQPQGFGLGRIVLGILFVVVLLVLVKTGNIGWAFYLLTSIMGGGGGGGGGRDDDDGGGFGGIGGGASGGGGASRDY